MLFKEHLILVPLIGERKIGVSDLYEQRRNTVDENARKLIYNKIDSISGVAATYAVANEYDKMISSLGAKGTNAYTSLERTEY